MHYHDTGLLVHGYDETRTQKWANNITGACTSPFIVPPPTIADSFREHQPQMSGVVLWGGTAWHS